MATATQTVPTLFRDVKHPVQDRSYQMQRRLAIKELLRPEWSDRDLNDLLQYQMAQKVSDDRGVTKQVVGEMLSADYVPQTIKTILGSTSGGGLNDGSPLIRQDLEPVLYALFVRAFPAFERLRKAPSNGLVHRYCGFMQ